MKVYGGSVFALAALLACVALFSIRSARGENPRGAEYRISGPYNHENLSIFLIHGKNRADGKLLTLEEAVAQHKVVVYETRNVNELTIENVSNQDVFIESGDIVKGGAQDRTLKDDFILPTKSGKVNISAFCVEHGRWTQRSGEPVGTFNSATESVVSKDMKMAVRVKADQRSVWDSVASLQASIAGALRSEVRAAPSPTSLPMTMQTPVVQKSIDGYLRDLKSAIDGQTDVIGYAFAINGEVNSADVYGSHELFGKLWPKLLRASAVEAVSKFDAGKKFAPPAADAVMAALYDAESGRSSSRRVTERVSLVTKESPRNMMFETQDHAQDGAWIHRNYLTK